MEEKSKAIALVEEYLSADIYDRSEELKEVRRKIRETKENIKMLQNSDDVTKIRKISEDITMLYSAAKDISSVVDDDIFQSGFKIKYLKRGNILQPTIETIELGKDDIEKKVETYYYIGSKAQRTLIQLCGYLGFLKLLLSENKYPIIPLLVIDHISQPFDEKNVRAIGEIINKAIEEMGSDNLQIIMFDEKEYQTLGIKPDYSENLVGEKKSGFNPFYYAAGSKMDDGFVENEISKT